MSRQSQNTFPVDNAKEAAEWLESAMYYYNRKAPTASIKTRLMISSAHALLAIHEELRDLGIEVRNVARLLPVDVTE